MSIALGGKPANCGTRANGVDAILLAGSAMDKTASAWRWRRTLNFTRVSSVDACATTVRPSPSAIRHHFRSTRFGLLHILMYRDSDKTPPGEETQSTLFVVVR